MPDKKIVMVPDKKIALVAHDNKALLRLAVVWNIPIACNRASADFMISSPLMDGEYDRLVPDYAVYRRRAIPLEEPSGEGGGAAI